MARQLKILGAWLCLGLMACQPQLKQPAAPPTPMTEKPLSQPPPSVSQTEGESAQPPIEAPTSPSPLESPVDKAANLDSKAGEVVNENRWSKLHLCVLADGGPRLLRIDAQIAGQEINSGFDQAVDELAGELGFDLAQPVLWNEVLDHPLVRSGWLGNLVATTEQRSQLIGMYDSQGDGCVQPVELQAFLTRGLSRQPRLRLVANPQSPPLLALESPWGPLDENRDGVLTMAELAIGQRLLGKYDFDGDQILTLGELRASGEMNANMMSMPPRRTSMLESQAVIVWNQSQPDGLSSALLKQYTFTDTLPRQEWSHWHDARFQRVDINLDGQLTRAELSKMNDGSLDITISAAIPDSLALPNNQNTNNQDTIRVSSRSAPGGQFDSRSVETVVTDSTLRLAFAGCIISVRSSDDYSAENREQFVQYVQRARSDKQLEGVLGNALGLGEAAWELLMPSTADTLPDQANESPEHRAWRWVVGPRQWMVQVGWSISTSPWFELLDQNGDMRLSASELQQLKPVIVALDRDGDGQLMQSEMPLSILLDIKRIEPRGFLSRLGGTTQEKRGANDSSAPTWFTAMDYNLDGELSQSEFLGDVTDFEKLDRDRDGVIQARELKAP